MSSLYIVVILILLHLYEEPRDVIVWNSVY